MYDINVILSIAFDFLSITSTDFMKLSIESFYGMQVNSLELNKILYSLQISCVDR